MTIASAALSSVPSLDFWSDHTVSITFRTGDPIGLTEVTVDPEPADTGVLLHLVDAALIRLVAWRRDFIEEEAASTDPVPDRMPLYEVGR